MTIWCRGLDELYTNGVLSRCEFASGVALLEAREPLSAREADEICDRAPCRTVFERMRSLNLSNDCPLANDTMALFRGVLDPLADSPKCANATAVGSGSGDGADAITFPPSYRIGPYGYANDGLSTATIVGIVLGAVAALAIAAGAFFALRRRRQKTQSQRDHDALALDAKKDGGDVFDNDASPQSMDGTAPLTSPVRFHNPSAPTASRDGASSRMPVPSAPSASRLSMPQPSAPTASGARGPGPSAPTASLTLSMLDASRSSLSVEELLANDEELLARHMRADDVEDIRVIGSGGHGIVYLVRYRRTRLLASKRLVLDRVTTPKMLAFIDEIKLVSRLEHACIVPFVGAAWTNGADIQALFEYMPNGDLCTHLAKTDHRDPTRGWDTEKLQIALDVIHALVYVHSFAPPLVHRDLKSRNVLLDENMRGKLSDFGVSRYQSDALTMTTGVGTSRWLAPEVINGGGEYNESCDVYSFGMVLVELDTHALPFAGLRSATRNAMPEMAMLQLVSEGKLQPTFRESCPASVLVLARRCLAFNPTLRPSAMDVAFALRTIAESEFQYEPLH